ncbi:MAG: glycoside hydrolase family 9 protein [Chryseolinea sp.]
MRFTRIISLVVLFKLFVGSFPHPPESAWIRINLIGYKPSAIKVAVWCGKKDSKISTFDIVDMSTSKVVYSNKIGKAFGAYGPFTYTYRLDFTQFSTRGIYFIRTGDVRSPTFRIDEAVYKGTADFSLRYMRQQRSKYNPFLRDSCHTSDGYTMDGPMPDSTHVDVSGGWHDATDYLQYSMTSANATYHLLAAYRDFPGVFGDGFRDNGLEGSNGTTDVMDEARWGLQWLMKMHPNSEWMFNQLADDRDHTGFRLPNKDTASYGNGRQRPVYFVTGKVQGLGKYKNRTTGTSSTAGKFSSAFALGSELYKNNDADFSSQLRSKALSAYNFGLRIPGNTQTACYVSPYFYEEDNWVDDMELASAKLYGITGSKSYYDASIEYARKEQQTPWLGKDTASHYQWYPFINIGHYELASLSSGAQKAELISYYKRGIEMVYNKASQNAFLRGVPFIWCSNNLQTAFAIQCYWYRVLSGDQTYAELEQATFDFLLGCNPWGTSMIVGLPENGDFPDDPHSSFNFLNGYQTLGALVDGPVYGSIYKKQLGVSIAHGDEYAEFQSPHVVYHDDYADYVTNEPTMDGTASLVYLLAAKENESPVTIDHGAITRGDQTSKKLAIVFTGDSFGDGGDFILKSLKNEHVKASFFLTGNFYRNTSFAPLIKRLVKDHHYLGAHSDQHLLYCSWTDRDSTLVSKKRFTSDLEANYRIMKTYGIEKSAAKYFLPPYEWYNDSISRWSEEIGLQIINYSPGTISHADYTTPSMKNYRSSDEIMQSIEQKSDSMNGFILLLHIGTDPERKDKLYLRLPELIRVLKSRHYELVTIDRLLSTAK